jgi:YEATS family
VKWVQCIGQRVACTFVLAIENWIQCSVHDRLLLPMYLHTTTCKSVVYAIHRSMFYCTNLSHRVQVSFALHASFAIPNRELTAPPYEVHEQGWGEFDVQIKVSLTAYAYQCKPGLLWFSVSDLFATAVEISSLLASVQKRTNCISFNVVVYVSLHHCPSMLRTSEIM